MKLTNELQSEYEYLYNSMDVPHRSLSIFRWHQKHLLNKIVINKHRYEHIEKCTGCPWTIIATIHMKECGLSFKKHLHNGNLLSNGRTTWVPKDRPKLPPLNGSIYTWDESAIDAIQYELEKNDINPKTIDWNIATALWFMEAYNGWGYRVYHKDVFSSYLWANTNHHSSGRYVADGKWDQTAKPKNIGAALIMRELDLEGDLKIDLSEPTKEGKTETFAKIIERAERPKSFWASICLFFRQF